MFCLSFIFVAAQVLSALLAFLAWTLPTRTSKVPTHIRPLEALCNAYTHVQTRLLSSRWYPCRRASFKRELNFLANEQLAETLTLLHTERAHRRELKRSLNYFRVQHASLLHRISQLEVQLQEAKRASVGGFIECLKQANVAKKAKEEVKKVERRETREKLKKEKLEEFVKDILEEKRTMRMIYETLLRERGQAKTSLLGDTNVSNDYEVTPSSIYEDDHATLISESISHFGSKSSFSLLSTPPVSFVEAPDLDSKDCASF